MTGRWVLRGTLLTTACYVLTSCATLDQAGARHGTAIGCGVGAMLGGVIGNVVGQRTGNRSLATATGAAVGTAVGCYVGNRWQQRQQALAELAKREHMQIDIQVLAEAKPATAGAADVAPQQSGLVASIRNQGMFAVDGEQFTADGLRQARELARLYRPDVAAEQGQQRTVLLVVGHSDSSGQADYNQALSERRAQAMGRVLTEAGVDARDIYYQGAGAARPIADNHTEQGRSLNRRVELVELSSTDLLIQRIEQERANPRYLSHGTRNVPTLSPAKAAAVVASPSPVTQTGQRRAVATAARHPAGYVDFGGVPATQDELNLARMVTPRRSGFSLISEAFAADAPLRSCEADRPRVAGGVKNLASGQALDTHATREYLPGMNGRAWAGLVNGNLVTISPVSVLRDGAEVAGSPKVYVTPAYTKGKREAVSYSAISNTYEGEENVLYRVFVQADGAPLSCMDLVLRKSGTGAAAGKLFYDHTGDAYVATFTPTRS